MYCIAHSPITRIFCLLVIFTGLWSCKSSKPKAKDKQSLQKSTLKQREAEELVEKAKKHVGTRYKSGGKDPATGFDCSGFTCYIYAKYNILLPPTAAQQSQMGWSVSIKEAQKGDLIFFEGENAGSGTVGHVGIVVSDKGHVPVTFIHASSSKGIMISTLAEPYFQKRFVKIKRISF